MFKKTILILLLVTASALAYGQTLIYTFIDPCTKETTLFTVPAQGTVIFFLNQSRSFTPGDVSNGTLSSWVNQVYSDYRKISPCGVQSGQVNQNLITSQIIGGTVQSVVSSIMASAASASGGGDDAASKGKTQSDNKKKKNENTSNNNSNSISNNGINGSNSTNSGSTQNNQTSNNNTSSPTTNSGGGNTTNNGTGNSGNTSSGSTTSQNSQSGDSKTKGEYQELILSPEKYCYCFI